LNFRNTSDVEILKVDFDLLNIVITETGQTQILDLIQKNIIILHNIKD
jgi:hypothetical protein